MKTEMDTMVRTVVKAITWQSLGILTMTALSYPHTGSLAGALSIATSASASGFVFFLLHEKIWNRVRWGRRQMRPACPDLKANASDARQTVLEQNRLPG